MEGKAAVVGSAAYLKLHRATESAYRTLSMTSGIDLI
tara:strand:- start:1165 stop:1275 length:111 start_codon:yes stop_codon:yes gene_type:complete